jgi:Predicted transcriptional regulator containing the HTH domain
MDARGAVEAALFSSAEPLRASVIAEKTGLDEGIVKNEIKELALDYERRRSAIRISKIGPEYVMQLSDEFREYAMTFSEREIPRGVLKTAAAIAYNQPVLQSELCRSIGPRVYEDVKDLIARELVHGKHKGQTLELTVTKKFCEYFGIEGTSKEAIRKWIEKRE